MFPGHSHPLHRTTITTGQDLSKLCPSKPCSGCAHGCKGQFDNFHCPICPPTRFKPTRKPCVMRHLQAHFYGCKGHVAVKDFIITVCRMNCLPNKRGHYHCPLCYKSLSKRRGLSPHIRRCSGENKQKQGKGQRGVIKTDTDSRSFTGDMALDNDGGGINDDFLEDKKPMISTVFSDKIDAELGCKMNDTGDEGEMKPQVPVIRAYTANDSKACPWCSKRYHKKYINAHIKKIHMTSKEEKESITASHHHHSVCIDPSSGLYTVTRTIRGPQHPIHVVCRLDDLEQHLECTLTSCQELTQTEWRSGNCGFMCNHLKSVQYNQVGSMQCVPKISVLNAMTNSNLLSKTMAGEVLEKLREAETARAPFLVELPAQANTNTVFQWFSVYTGKGSIRWWCKFCRTVVTVNKKTKHVFCQCKMRRCVHQAAVQWWLYQNTSSPGVSTAGLWDNTMQDDSLHNDTTQEDTSQDDIHEEEATWSEGPPNTRALQQTVEYLCARKCIAASTLQDYMFDPERLPQTFSPPETHCFHCQCPLAPQKLVTRRARVLVLPGPPLEGYESSMRSCPSCLMEYRYQEWHHGVFNYDNRLFVSLPLLKTVRKALTNNTPISKFTSIFEEEVGGLSPHLFERVYLAFEAMVVHTYNFSCVRCGIHPKTLIYDLTRKTTFQYDALDQNGIDSHALDETVDADHFWNDIQKELVSHSVILSGQNPFKVPVSPHCWAPYLGPQSRSSEWLYNSEQKKLTPGGDQDLQEPMTEEAVYSILSGERVDLIRRLCRKLGLPVLGGRLTLMNQIHSAAVSKATFDSAYTSVFSQSAGWLSAFCPHGVTYAIKCLLRMESPRDYIDLLRSMKYTPTVNISNVADSLASAANRLLPGIFWPNEGRLIEATEDNIRSAKNKNLTVSLPALQDDCPVEGSHPDVHPITGLVERFSLFGWFHEENLRSPEEVLRKGSLLKELAGYSHSSPARRLCRDRAKDTNYCSATSPSHHLFCYRLVQHLRNDNINQQEVTRQSSRLQDLTLNHLGQLVKAAQAEADLDGTIELKVLPIGETL